MKNSCVGPIPPGNGPGGNVTLCTVRFSVKSNQDYLSFVLAPAFTKRLLFYLFSHSKGNGDGQGIVDSETSTSSKKRPASEVYNNDNNNSYNNNNNNDFIYRGETRNSVEIDKPVAQIKLEFGGVGFCGGRKSGEPGEKPSKQGENQQQTQPT